MVAQSLVECAISGEVVYKNHTFRCNVCKKTCLKKYRWMKKKCGENCRTNICVLCKWGGRRPSTYTKTHKKVKCECRRMVCGGCVVEYCTVSGCIKSGCVHCMHKCPCGRYVCDSHKLLRCKCGNRCCDKCCCQIYYRRRKVKCKSCSDACSRCGKSIKWAYISNRTPSGRDMGKSSLRSVCGFGDLSIEYVECDGDEETDCYGTCGEYIYHTGDIDSNFCEHKKIRICDRCWLDHACCGRVNEPKHVNAYEEGMRALIEENEGRVDNNVNVDVDTDVRMVVGYEKRNTKRKKRKKPRYRNKSKVKKVRRKRKTRSERREKRKVKYWN